MPISTICPACDKRLKIPDHLAGRPLKCPHCNGALGPVEAPTQSGRSPDAPTIMPSSESSAPAGTVMDSLGLLAPPQGPGEIGWLGGYRVIRILGQGGMGVVFHAEDVKLQRTVALKAMKPSVSGGEAGKRFLREARAAAAIEHDHIVSIYQVGEDRGVPFLAMQFLRGEALDERLRRQRILPLAEVLRIGREIAEGLSAAHERGLIHRDIKPANIFLSSVVRSPLSVAKTGNAPASDNGLRTTDYGQVKIVDFGLARSVREEEAKLTRLGAIVGTPAYMAPEQASGKEIDARADLFSLGCVLYRMATGQTAFQGADVIALLMAVVTDEPKSPREINRALPKELSDLIGQLLAKDPDRRPQSARAVAETLAALEARQQRPALRRASMFAVAAALVVVVGGAGVLIGSKLFGPPVPSGSPAAGERVPDATRPRAEPLSELALVHRPASLPGVRSWTIETTIHRGQVNRVAFQPKGRILASAGGDGVIRLWDPATGQLLRALLGHNSPIAALAWSPDGRLLASAGTVVIPSLDRNMPIKIVNAIYPGEKSDPTVRLWDVDSGRLVHVLTDHEDTVRALAWSPDSKTLASAGHDRIIRLWDAGTGKKVRSIPRRDYWFHALAWSPDGKMLASDNKANIDIYEADTGRPVRTLTGHGSWILTLAWSPDGKMLASGCADRTVRLWDVRAQKCLHVLSGPEAIVRSLAWHPRDPLLAVVCDEKKPICVWNSTTGERVASWTAGDVTSLDWEPAGQLIATGNWNGSVQLWKADAGGLHNTLAGPAAPLVLRPIACSPDGRTIAFAAGSVVRIRDADTGKDLRTISTRRTALSAVAWSPDGKTLATAENRQNTVQFWDAETGKARSKPLAGHTNWIHSLAFSPDSKLLVSGGIDTTVLLWDADKGELLRSLEGNRGVINFVAFSPDGKTVAVSSADRIVRLWDAGTGMVKHEGEHEAAVFGLAFSPDGTMLATSSGDKTVRLWQVEPFKLLHTLARHDGSARRVAWLPDGRTLASLDDGRRLRLWDTHSGELLRSYTDVARFGQFSGDGTWLMVGLTSKVSPSLRVFDTATGRAGGTHVQLTPEHTLMVSSDGHYRCTPGAEEEIVYVAQTENGQEMMPPAEFARRFGWTNEPDSVRLLPGRGPRH
jgi:WD40 repeat protein/tRNA A-37 threonylcarbamoyl transferase component Bud32